MSAAFTLVRRCASLSVVISAVAACGGAEVSSTNAFFRVSASSVEFDSRNDVESVTLQIEGLTPGIVVSAEAISAGPALTSEVDISKTGLATADLTIVRRDPDELDAGDHRGQVRVRGCLGDECEDALIDIRYLVVKLVLSQAAATFRQRVGDGTPAPVVVALSHSDGSDSAWTAQILPGIDPTDWLSVTPSGSSIAATAVIAVEAQGTPVSYAAWIEFTTDSGVARCSVRLDVVAGLNVDTEEVAFAATVDEVPPAQTIQLSDAAGGSYPWQAYFLPTNTHDDLCPVYAWLTVIPGSGLTLPATVELAPKAVPEAHVCTGDLELVTDGVVNRVVPVEFVVSE